MRNDGQVAWPEGTTFVPVGGDDMRSKGLAAGTVQLPAAGVAPGAEIDISVELVAPFEPGRYRQMWRLWSPSTHRFGHRVWVEIVAVGTSESQEPQEPQGVQEAQAPHELQGPQEPQ